MNIKKTSKHPNYHQKAQHCQVKTRREINMVDQATRCADDHINLTFITIISRIQTKTKIAEHLKVRHLFILN